MKSSLGPFRLESRSAIPLIIIFGSAMVARGTVLASALALSLHLGTPARGFQLRHGPVSISRSARRASCSSFPHMNTGKRRADASSRGWALGAVDICSDELDSILPSIGSPTGEADNDKREKILENESPGKVLASSESESGFDRTSSYPAVPTLRECFAFTLPALGIYAAPPLMSLIDAAFIGRTSSIELAALGPASSISDSATLPLLFLSIAATNLIAKSNTRGNDGDSRRVTRACLGLGGIGGALIAVAVFANRLSLSALYCGERAVSAAVPILTPFCSSYVAIRALALPAVVVASVAQAVCIGVKDTRTPVVAVLGAAVLNLLGDLVLVNGLGMGIAGAAWATSASQICSAGLLLRVLVRRGFLRSEVKSVSEEVGSERSTVDTFKTILGFVPFLFVMAIKIGMHNTAAATAASLGGAPAAAHTALFAIAMLCFCFGDAGSSLSQAFLPAFASKDSVSFSRELNGEKNRRKASFDTVAAWPTLIQLLKCSLGISVTVVTIATVLLTTFPNQFTNDAAVIRQMRNVLPLMAATLAFHGTAVTLEGLLLSQQNFRGLTLTYLGVGVTIAAIFRYLQTSGIGLLGVWATYVFFQLSRIIAFSVFGGILPSTRFRRSRWGRRKMQRTKVVA